ncbi:MAG: ATP-binding protein [Oscillospiraceae bacterium]|jgi:DNA replication protein DnaC|nr:ATP-binding protein [Oscillospiraceae bacterium]
MSIDAKLLELAMSAHDRAKIRHASELARRRERAYAANPRLQVLDARLADSMLQIVKLVLRTDTNISSEVARIRDDNLDLQEEREFELTRAGYPHGYIDDVPMCDKCDDAGYIGAEMCSCLMEYYKAELRKSLSSLLKLGDETFDSFNLNYYDDAADLRTGFSPRRSMEIVYETCVQYARRFGARSYNLFLCGATGLGKTFLSACIARVVSEGGHSVVYDTTPAIFARLEEEKFSKAEDALALREETRRFRDCDLLIMDDLGTEMQTSFTNAALYDLVNSRLITGKKTIISSNLTTEDLRRRYSPQIVSRLLGEYQVLMFYGRDIRLIKNGLAPPPPI